MMQEDSASDVGESGDARMALDGDDTTNASTSDVGDARAGASDDDEPDRYRDGEGDDTVIR
jgi:hypothetical protein